MDRSVDIILCAPYYYCRDLVPKSERLQQKGCLHCHQLATHEKRVKIKFQDPPQIFYANGMLQIRGVSLHA